MDEWVWSKREAFVAGEVVEESRQLLARAATLGVGFGFSAGVKVLSPIAVQG